MKTLLKTLGTSVIESPLSPFLPDKEKLTEFLFGLVSGGKFVELRFNGFNLKKKKKRRGIVPFLTTPLKGRFVVFSQ